MLLQGELWISVLCLACATSSRPFYHMYIQVCAFFVFLSLFFPRITNDLTVFKVEYKIKEIFFSVRYGGYHYVPYVVTLNCIFLEKNTELTLFPGGRQLVWHGRTRGYCPEQNLYFSNCWLCGFRRNLISICWTWSQQGPVLGEHGPQQGHLREV